jgi:type II secretory pathway pseudopilin PulG
MTIRRRDESGFALIEVVAAFAVLGLLFVAIEWVAIGSTQASVTGSQRATATSLASQAIAQAEALPFADLQAGLNSTQLAAVLACSTWPQVASAGGGVYNLQIPGTPTVPILTANSATSGEPPLVPFSCTPVQQIGGVSYNVGVFPALVSGKPNLVTITAIVNWTAPPMRTQATAVEQVEVGAQ